MKILSDFDGVLTNLTSEAARVNDLFESHLQERSKLPHTTVQSWISQGRAAMRSRPYEYGWKVKGRIAAFCNEDGFIRVNSLGAYLEDRANDGDRELVETRERLRSAGIDGYYGLAHASYIEMTEATASGELKPLEASSAAALKQLLDRGHEIVIVSNSGTERICQLLRGANLEPVAHETQRKSDARLRVRGNAGKFLLGDEPQTFQIGEYTIDTDRPQYRDILVEERPDVVVGDVFSLDLALPTSLAAREPNFKNLQIWLRKRDYTPDWSLEFIQANTWGVKGGVLEGYDDLLAMAV